jgi:hypothetical protein
MSFGARETPPAPVVSYRRAILVALVFAVALAIPFADEYAKINRSNGSFGFSTCGEIVCVVEGEAKDAGIEVGDRLNVRALPLDKRHMMFYYPRPPRAGDTVSFPLERGDSKYVVTLTARRDDGSPGIALLILFAAKVAAIVLAVLASALFLVRPTPLTGSLAFYALGNFSLEPSGYAFLPALAYAGVQILTLGFFEAAGTIGFLGLALYLGRASLASVRRLLITLFAVFAISLSVQPIFALLGFYVFKIYTVTYAAIVCVFTTGSIILIGTALRRTAPPGERLAALLFAVAGLAIVFLHSYQLLIGAIPALDRLNDAWWIVPQWVAYVASAVAGYVIVRDRIVDIGLVRSRILAYGATVVAVLAAFGFVNWAFASALATFPLAFPLEIFAAVAIGYWFSGFRDVSTALSLAAVDAPIAAMNGRRVDEHDALARALGLAERTRQASLIAEIRARCAFSAWVNGDDPVFEQHANASDRALGSQKLRGIKTFVLAATSEESPAGPDAGDLPEWLARASLIRCARSADARRTRERAYDAVRRADENGEPWLRVLARVALAESESSARAQCLNEADAIARGSGSLLLMKSLAALRAGKRDLGILHDFVEVRIRKIRPICPAVEIAFFTGEVRMLGEVLELPDKERELLFTLAASNGLMNGDLLCDVLWPESDGDAARNAFHVCLHRLRKHARDPRIVQCLDQGYALHPGADVDLWRLEAALASAQADEVETLSQLARGGEARRASLGRWFAPFEIRLTHTFEKIERLFEVERVRNGIQRSEPSVSFPLSSG